VKYKDFSTQRRIEPSERKEEERYVYNEFMDLLERLVYWSFGFGLRNN